MLKRIVALYLLCTVTALFSPQASVSALEPHVQAPWDKSCNQYHSSRDFVSDSALFCLKQQNQRACDQMASRHFTECRYRGDYERLSQKFHARMLVLIALAGTRPISEDSLKRAS